MISLWLEASIYLLHPTANTRVAESFRDQEPPLAPTARTIHEEPGGERATYRAHQRWHPPRHPFPIGGDGRSDERSAETKGEGQAPARPGYRLFDGLSAPEIHLQPRAGSGPHRPF